MKKNQNGSRAEYNAKYQKENIQRFSFKLNKKTDGPEIFGTWSKIKHKTAFLKSSIALFGQEWIDNYDGQVQNGEYLMREDGEVFLITKRNDGWE